MILTAKAALVRFNRPVLLGGTAILGVASAKLVANATVQSVLLAIAAICLMYVGDVCRAVSDRVVELLPKEATPDLVKSTQAHNLGGARRSFGLLLLTTLAVLCLIASLVISITRQTSSQGGSKRAKFAVSAPHSYTPGAGALVVSVQCPDQCVAHAALHGPSGTTALTVLSLPEGRTTISLPSLVTRLRTALPFVPEAVIFEATSDSRSPIRTAIPIRP